MKTKRMPTHRALRDGVVTKPEALLATAVTPEPMQVVESAWEATRAAPMEA
jgi:hypothetical protein